MYEQYCQFICFTSSRRPVQILSQLGGLYLIRKKSKKDFQLHIDGKIRNVNEKLPVSNLNFSITLNFLLHSAITPSGFDWFFRVNGKRPYKHST